MIDSRPPASKYQMRRRAEGFGRSHGGGRRQGTIRIGAVLQQHERPWWSMIRLRERDEVDGGSCISAKHASSSLSLKILLSCVDGDCGLVNSGRGGSGDSPSTGERSGASWAVATACLTAVWAVGVGKGGVGSASAMVSPCGGD